MINWKRLVFLIVVLTFVFGAANLALLKPRVYIESETVKLNRQKLGASISLEILHYTRGDISAIDFSKIKTPFSWDRLYIFEPYTEKSKIDDVLGKAWIDNESCTTEISSSDGITLLIFTMNGKVAQCLQSPRSEHDFANLAKYESGFSIQEARFVLDERGNVIFEKSK